MPSTPSAPATPPPALPDAEIHRSAPLPSSSSSVEADVREFIEQLRPGMTCLVRGEISLPVWKYSPGRDDAEDSDSESSDGRARKRQRLDSVSAQETRPDGRRFVQREPEPETARLAAHVDALRIPLLKGRPNVLLHDLGSFVRDSDLAARLKNVFMPNSHTFLVNTSGSGKTRILLEGLCANWGFYFTSLVDSSSLGSTDVQNSIRSYVPDDPKFTRTLPPLPASAAASSQAAGGNKKKRKRRSEHDEEVQEVQEREFERMVRDNRDVAYRAFSRVLLARLEVFDLFTELMVELGSGQGHRREGTENEEETGRLRHRWLLLQLQPSLIHPQVWDTFDHLVGKLAPATDAYVNARIKTLLGRVRERCGVRRPVRARRAETSQPQTSSLPLFCVLDEAQHAASSHSQAFLSASSRASPTQRPILREIVRAWEAHCAAHGVFMVVAGTGVSKDVVDRAVASAVMKDGKYRWCSDTGAFAREEDVRRYVRRFLPPWWGVGSGAWEWESARRLEERVGYWLRGRHRFTAGYVAELVYNGFRNPHTLLNRYIEHFTQFTPTDGQKFVKAESEAAGSMVISSRYKPDFSKLAKNSDMVATIHQLTMHYLMRSNLPPSLGKDEALYVEHGFARFFDAETHAVVADEPLVLLAAMRWTETHYRSAYKFFAKQIQAHETNSNGFENFVAFCVDLAFGPSGRGAGGATEGGKGRRVDEVFKFVGPRVPEWATQEAELVSLFRTLVPDSAASSTTSESQGVIEPSRVFHSAFGGPCVTLGVNAKTTAQTTRWLRHETRAPICFPNVRMGPDLVFVLRLADGTFVWVVLQAKYSRGKGKSGKLPRKLLRSAFRSVTPSNFFLDKDGNAYSPADDPHIAQTTLEHLSALPNRRADCGRYSLLRVVASFPADASIKRCLEEDPDEDGHPIACLNMEFVKRITRELSPVDFLKSLEAPREGSGAASVTSSRKRKTNRGHEARKPTKKINLN